MRHFLFILSEEDTLDKDVMVYNPFTQLGNLIYMKRHKEFYDKNEKKFNPKPLTAKAYKKIIKEHKKNLQKKKKKKQFIYNFSGNQVENIGKSIISIP